MQRLIYLDTFRGLAVLLVLLFHFGIFTNGFVGVEMFFVISGYIITLLLVKEWNTTQKFNLKSFYTRRISRIYPALLVLIIVSVVFFINFPILSITEKFFSEVKYSAFGFTNWYELWHNNGYWEMGVKSPLLHLWSLAIELQFYALYPIFFKIFLEKSPTTSIFKKRFFIFLLMSILLFFSWTLYSSFNSSFDTLYYSTFTRISSFLIGGLFGGMTLLCKESKLKSLSITFMTSAIIILMIPLFTLSNISLFRGEILAFSFCLGLLFFNLHLNQEHPLISNIFRIKILSSIGVISYSLYLWHIPVKVFLSPDFFQNNFKITITNQVLMTSVQIGLSFVFAFLSYFLIEKKVKVRMPKKALLLGLAFPMIIFSLTTEYVDNSLKFVHTRKNIENKWIESSPIVTKGDSPLLVIGDSWSRRLAFGLDQFQKQNHNEKYQILLYGSGNASIMDPEALIQNGQENLPFKSFDGYLQYWDLAIKKYHPKKVLIISGLADQAKMIIQGKKTQVGSNEFDKVYQVQFDKLVRFFQEQNIEIYMTNIPNAAHSSNTINLNKTSDAINHCFEKATNRYPDIHVLNLKKLLQNGSSPISKPIINNTFMYDETNHPSFDGSYYIGDWLLKQLNK